MPAEREQPSGLINTGELADLVAHEVNNLLNSIVLHVALLERSLPAEAQTAVQPELGVIRQAVHRAGAMLRRWQQAGPKPAVSLRGVDLHQVLRELPLPEHVHNAAGETVAIRFQPAASLPPVLGNVEDIRRLVSLLLRSAVEASPGNGTIMVRTEPAQASVLLSVEDQGAAVEPGLLERVFEPFAGIRSGLVPKSEEAELWLATCKVLARRQKGTITATSGAAGGMTITVRFSAAPSDTA